MKSNVGIELTENLWYSKKGKYFYHRRKGETFSCGWIPELNDVRKHYLHESYECTGCDYKLTKVERFIMKITRFGK